MALEAPITKVAVVGCGAVGAAWTALFSAWGISVSVRDPKISTESELKEKVLPAREALRSLGLMGEGSIRLVESVSQACSSCQFVQESTRENVAEKIELLAELDTCSPPDAIIASSTSSFLWSDLVTGAKSPNRIIIAHPFNPAHLIPLVEIFGNDSDVVGRACSFYKRIGKVPVVLKREARGHIANRLSSALFREAVHLVIEGIASVDDVDTALREGPGLRWSVIGVHQGYHLGAGRRGIRGYIEHLGASQKRRWEDLGQPDFSKDVQETLINAVEAAYGDRSIQELEAERDAVLMAHLLGRKTPLE
jgi:carnitine 3-dehydrogenase